MDELIDSLAGILGVDPAPYTLRSLVRMTEARARFEWNQTSSLMALVVNLMRDPRHTKPVRSSDFNPFIEPEKPIVLEGKDFSILRDVFVRDKQ